MTTVATTTTKLVADFKAARRVSTPLLGITTPDPAATMDMLASALDADVPVIRWDVVRGMVAGNKAGQRALKDAGISGDETGNPVEALIKAHGLPQGACVFLVHIHLFLKEPGVLQGIWNLRDEFKVNRRTLVLLAPSLHLPGELEHDVIVLDEPLPTHDELAAIIRAQCENAKLTPPEGEALERAIDAVTGLAAFTVEQVVAMSLSKKGIDVDALWERKRQAIEQTPGMNVWRGGETLEDVAGYENAKLAVRRLKGSRREPRVVVFIDEIEKMLAGAGGDTSGVSQDQLGQLLTYMQDHKVSGMIFIGPPGSGKTAIAKAAGNTLGVPTIALDLGGMKGSLVGESEMRVRQALKVITAVGSDQALFIATCNSIGALPPELRRRFTRGTFFFDLPTAEERRAIWQLYIRKYELTPEQTAQMPNDTDWTGAEIAQCATMAWDMHLTLVEAAEYVVPVSKSARESIERLRTQASGRFISASYPGVYEKEPVEEAEPVAAKKRQYQFQ